MAFDKTQIINRALVKVGSRPIVNLEDDDTQESNTALNLYDMALEMLLSETLWTFATKRILLATLSETIPWVGDKEAGLNYTYQRPTDIIRVFRTNDDGAYWKEEGDTIISDTTGLGILYTYRNEDTSTYPPHFAQALSDLMAGEMSFALLNSKPKTESLVEYYERVSLPKAISQNAQIGTPKELNDNYWLNARYGGPNTQELS